MTNEATGRPSTPALFADALSQMTSLFETEIRLVRTELSEKISMAFRAIAVLLVSAVLMLAALFIILVGIVQLLIAFGMPPWGAYFLVGLVIAVIGGISLYFALKNLSADNLMPRRTMTQLGKDAEVVKEQIR